MKLDRLGQLVGLAAALAAVSCQTSEADDTASDEGDGGGDDDDATAGDDDATGDDDDDSTEGESDDGDDPCREITPTEGEVQVGSVVPDFVLKNQEGNDVRLYDHCGETVLMIATAAW